MSDLNNDAVCKYLNQFGVLGGIINLMTKIQSRAEIQRQRVLKTRGECFDLIIEYISNHSVFDKVLFNNYNYMEILTDTYGESIHDFDLFIDFINRELRKEVYDFGVLICKGIRREGKIRLIFMFFDNDRSLEILRCIESFNEIENIDDYLFFTGDN